MRTVKFVAFQFVMLSVVVFGQTNQLVISSIMDGAYYLNPSSQKEAVSDASFIRKNSTVSVRPRSGLETFATNFLFRYGSSTKFSCAPNYVEIHEGGIMVQSRNINSSLNMESPEVSSKIKGSGTLLAEVETNGGMKLIGVLGTFRIFSNNNDKGITLLPGELVFVLPGDRGFGPKVQVNLSKLISSSFLLSGFNNSSSFQASLTTTAQAQKAATGKVYAAEVGDSVQSNSFQIVPTENKSPKEGGMQPKPFSEVNQLEDPLSALLGRSPYRSSSKNYNLEKIGNSIRRPFPSRLLRNK